MAECARRLETLGAGFLRSPILNIQLGCSKGIIGSTIACCLCDGGITEGVVVVYSSGSQGEGVVYSEDVVEGSCSCRLSCWSVLQLGKSGASWHMLVFMLCTVRSHRLSGIYSLYDYRPFHIT
jgi:hypothetical protein